MMTSLGRILKKWQKGESLRNFGCLARLNCEPPYAFLGLTHWTLSFSEGLR